MITKYYSKKWWLLLEIKFLFNFNIFSISKKKTSYSEPLYIPSHNVYENIYIFIALPHIQI